MQLPPPSEPYVRLSPHTVLQSWRWYDDSTTSFPYGTTVASKAKPSSMPPVVTGVVVSSLLLLLAVLPHVQAMTAWREAPTPPVPSCPHAGIVASSYEARWSRTSQVTWRTTSRGPLRCLLSTGCIWNNVPLEEHSRYPAPSLLGQVGQPLAPVRMHDLSPAAFSRHQRNQVWSVNGRVAASRRTCVTGLPTLTSATRERRPARPYTVIHV